MSKILELNGYKYSREEFEGHTHRAKFRLAESEYWRKDSCIDIYTNNPNKEKVKEVIKNRVKETIISCKMEHWTTKEQDDLTSKFIEETFKDL